MLGTACVWLCLSRHAPGIYHKSKGGISASLSAEEFKSEALAARLALLKRFPQLLPGCMMQEPREWKESSWKCCAALLLSVGPSLSVVIFDQVGSYGHQTWHTIQAWCREKKDQKLCFHSVKKKSSKENMGVKFEIGQSVRHACNMLAPCFIEKVLLCSRQAEAERSRLDEQVKAWHSPNLFDENIFSANSTRRSRRLMVSQRMSDTAYWRSAMTCRTRLSSHQINLTFARIHMSIGFKFKIKARLSLCRMSANARRTCFGRWKGGLCELASVMQVMVGWVTPAKRPAQAGWGRLTRDFKCLDMLYTSLHILGEGLAWILCIRRTFKI